MSKNHPNDNIYSILGKLQALEPTAQEQHDATVKSIYESVEAQGSILKGLRDVSSTEQRLQQQFAESEKWIQKTGVAKHKGDLHKALHVAQGEKIPAGKIEKASHSKNAHLRHMAQFAKNVAHEGVEEQNMGPGTGGMEEDYASMGTGYGTAGGVVETAPPGMEKMVMKLKKEYPGHPEKAFATAWSIYNKKHSKANENREACTECSMHEDPMGDIEGGTVAETNIKHVGKYGTEYYGTKDFTGDDEDTPKAKSTEKKGRGRPTKASTGEKTSQERMPWGGKPPKVDANPTKKWPKASTTVHKIAESMSTVGNRLLEGLNFKRMAEETHQSIDELMSELQQDINNYKATGHCSEKLKDFLQVHSHSKKQMADEAAMETAAQKPVPVNPHPVGSSLPARQIPGKEALLKGQGRTYYEEESIDPLEEELAKLAELAGLHSASSQVKESFEQAQPEFSLNTNIDSEGHKSVTIQAEGDQAEALLQMLKMAGLGSGNKARELEREPSVGGDEGCEEVADEGNEFSGKLAQARAQHADTFNVDGKEYPVDESDMEEGNAFSGALAKAKAQHKDKFDVDGHEYEVKEADAPVDQPDTEPANAPEPEYATMRGSTMGPGEGDPGEKAMNPDRPTFKNGDNALSNPPARKTALEAKLAAEYESIKKVS